MKIDPAKYATAASAAREVDVLRQTLDAAMRRGDPSLVVVETFGGLSLVSIDSARKWAKQARKRGPKS